MTIDRLGCERDVKRHDVAESELCCGGQFLLDIFRRGSVWLPFVQHFVWALEFWPLRLAL